MRRTDLAAAAESAPWRDTREFDDILVTVVPEPWTATRLERAVGRTQNLVTSLAVVGWCGTRELRLVRGPDTERLARFLTPVVDFVTSVLPGSTGPGVRRPRLTLTNVPDGHRLFDELAAGRKIVVAELALAGPEAMNRWLRVLASMADRIGDGEERCGTRPRRSAHAARTASSADRW